MTRHLLLLNVLVLAAGLAWPYLAALRTSALEEFNAGKIRFWSQPEAYKAGSRTTPQEAAKPAAALCLGVTPLNQERFEALAKQLQAAGLAGAACSYRFDKDLGWWVFWPPEYEAARRAKVMRAIQAAGVKDVLPISQGAMAQAYSLGVFRSEAQAHQYRDALRGKGLDKVEYGPRPSMATGYLGCQGSDPGKIAAFKAELPSWAEAADEPLCWPAGR